jgi:uncharacterized protein
MAIDPTMSATANSHPTRRNCLLALAGGLLSPGAWASPTGGPSDTLVAAWEADSEYRVGLITVGPEHWAVQQSVTVPTRPHALLAEPGGTVLAVARRPGDWLLRWRPGVPHHPQQWHWIGGDRRFNGHAVASADHTLIWTTETDLETAQGLIGVRDARSLEKHGEWATHGMDPHELLVLPEPVGACPAGTLMVANGGIPTLPETGRSKRQIERMDPSLVAVDPASGKLLGQWRLDDPHLSIRHLAWDTHAKRLGIALQAEHPAPEDRWRAPVLAEWDGARLWTEPRSPDLRGYGGAVAAAPGGGFMVGCPRAQALAVYSTGARWSHNLTLPDACAVAASDGRWWAGGSTGVLCGPPHPGSQAPLVTATTGAVTRWDNHWQHWPSP